MKAEAYTEASVLGVKANAGAVGVKASAGISDTPLQVSASLFEANGKAGIHAS